MLKVAAKVLVGKAHSHRGVLDRHGACIVRVDVVEQVLELVLLGTIGAGVHVLAREQAILVV